MKILRFIPLIFALSAIGATAGARAEESPPSAESVRPAPSAEAPLQAGDNRWATVGDIRHMENKVDSQISELRMQIQMLHAQNQGFHESLNTALLAVVGIFATMMAALLGLLWKARFGNVSASAALFLIPIALVAALTVGAAIAAVF